MATINNQRHSLLFHNHYWVYKQKGTVKLIRYSKSKLECLYPTCHINKEIIERKIRCSLKVFLKQRKNKRLPDPFVSQLGWAPSSWKSQGGKGLYN